MDTSDEIIKQSECGHRINVVIICVIISAAFLLRFKGVWFGYPLLVHPDEHHIVNSALNMIKSHTLQPSTFLYPSLNMYLQTVAYYALNTYNFMAGHSIADIAMMDYYLIGRTVTVLLSVATIYITYEIGKRLLNENIGILAAFFVCVSHLHLARSYSITVDSPVAFWTSLSMLMAVKIYKYGEKNKYYLLAGMFTGFAVSSKYTAIFAMLPMIIAHIYRVKKKLPKDWIDGNLISGLIAGAAAFIITTPYALFDVKGFINTLEVQRQQYVYGHPGAESSGNTSLLLYLSSLYKEGYGISPTIFACIGLIWLVIKDYWKALIIIIFPFVLLLFVGQYKTFFIRNVVAVIPFFAILTSVAIYNIAKVITQKIVIYSTIKKYNLIIMIIIAVITAGVSYASTSKSINELSKATLPDTRWIATKWILANFTTKLKIAREAYTPPIEEYSTNYLVTKLGYGKVVKPETKDVLANQDYVLLSSLVYNRFINYPEKYPEMAEGYNNFFKEHELVKEFLPDWKMTGGPTIRIYKINPRSGAFLQK